MGISNLASGLRTGVCTSTTRPTAPYNGQVIYETDSKQTLVWQGSAWVMLTDADTPPGLVLIKTQTVGSAVASVEVTSAFSSEFTTYRVIYTGGTTSANANIKMTLGSTTSGYSTNVIYTAWSNTPTIQVVGSLNGASWAYAGSGDPDGTYVHLDVANPYDTQRTFISGVYVGADTDRVGGTIAGMLTNTTSYSSFTFAPDAGTMTGGTIRVYGYRNAV